MQPKPASSRKIMRVIILFSFMVAITPVLAANSYAGTYDDSVNANLMSYRGSWYRYVTGQPGGSCDYCMWNTQSSTISSSGDEVDFTYTGSDITWFNSMAYNRGVKSVSIWDQSLSSLFYGEGYSDNVNFGAYNTDVRRQIGRTIALPYGTYRIIIRGQSGSFDLDSFAVDIQKYGLGSWKYDSGAIRFNGNWFTTTQGYEAVNGSLTSRNLARITLSGDSTITLVYYTGGDKDIASITIDGQDRGYY